MSKIETDKKTYTQQNTVLQRQNNNNNAKQKSDYLFYRFTRSNNSNESKSLTWNNTGDAKKIEHLTTLTKHGLLQWVSARLHSSIDRQVIITALIRSEAYVAYAFVAYVSAKVVKPLLWLVINDRVLCSP